MTTAYARPDAVLKRLVGEALAASSGLHSAAIGVAVENGAVMLSGQVDTYPQILVAEKAALRVQGVNVLQVSIDVAGEGPHPTDLEIAVEARLALQRAVNLPRTGLHVVVHGGVVTLTGSVPWHFQRQAAAKTVAQLHGVRDLVDRVTVAPQVPPVKLRAGIAAALRRNASVGERTITVVVDGSAVRLEGDVHSWQEKRAAASVVWSAPGVTSVDNRLRLVVAGDALLN